MNGRIDWSALFFSAEGRTGRGPSAAAAIVLIVLVSIYESLVEPDSMAALHWVSGVFVYGGLLYSAACVVSKRLHDRGKSGWWAAPVLLAIVMVWPTPTGVLDFLAVLVLIWALVELAVLPSEQGANRYGPNPQKVAAALA